jgi:hypothetical protein
LIPWGRSVVDIGKTVREVAMTITPAQCHAGRILAELERDDLAATAGLPPQDAFAFEKGGASLPAADIDKLQRALEAYGVLFVPEDADGGVGVRLKFDHEQASQLSTWDSEGGVAVEDHITQCLRFAAVDTYQGLLPVAMMSFVKAFGPTEQQQ